MAYILRQKKYMSEKLEFMLLALESSRRALCRPNPPVGCVIVHKGKVVSKGFTQSPGHHHAEIDAMSKLTLPIGECEIFVTLEPCSFQGRTPSCALTLAELKPQHIYIAIEDPHPRNRGEGLRILKNAGVGYTLGIGKKEVEDFLLSYLIRS
jgi:pyrimidine deaminase RibD-like protein